VLDANKGPRDEYFVKQTEAFGGEAGGKKAKAAKKAAAAAPKAEADPRAARFKERDPDHDGKITYEEFQSSMTDKKIAKERFETRDLNKDGGLSLEEFLATLSAAK